MNAPRKGLMTGKGLITGLVVLLILAGSWIWYDYWSPYKATHGGVKPTDQSVIPVTDFDAFQQNLADLVSKKFRVDAGSVVVAPAAYDLGWLLDSVQTYPADRTDCVPKPIPSAIPAQHLFPSYRLASSTAATMTLGSDALQQGPPEDGDRDRGTRGADWAGCTGGTA